MDKITTEQYREYDGRMCDLQYKLDCLERRKDGMIYEDYLRERSLIIYKMECHAARVSGKWNNTPKTETYKNESYGR